MKIHVISDVHIEFNPFEIPSEPADVVILAGDTHTGEQGIQWALEHLKDIPVIYVNGNHEYYGHSYPGLLQKQRALAQGTNVHLLENDAVVIDSVRFLGCTLWTNFKMCSRERESMESAQNRINDYKLIRKSASDEIFEPQDAAGAFRRSRTWLEKELADARMPTVVITHFAPHILSIPEQYREDILCAAFASDLSGFIRENDISLWIHGHLHDTACYELEGVRVVCNPRGYPSEYERSGFNPRFVIEL